MGLCNGKQIPKQEVDHEENAAKLGAAGCVVVDIEPSLKALLGTQTTYNEEGGNVSVLGVDISEAGMMDMVVAAGLSQIRWERHDEASNFLNDLANRIWPTLSMAVRREALLMAETEVRAALPDFIEGQVVVDRFVMPEKPPLITKIAAKTTSDGIRLWLNFEMDSGLDASVSVGIAALGITHLKVSGQLLVDCGPYVAELSVFRAIKATFLNPPILEYNFSGLAQVANIPPLRRAVRAAVDAVVATYIVAPNSIVYRLVSDDKALPTTTATPIGVIRVQAVQANGLAGKDWALFSKKTSDAYVKVMIGSDTWTSSIVKNTCDPVWKPDDYRDFIVYELDQMVYISVWDDDYLNDDDNLGYVPARNVKDSVGPGSITTTESLTPKLDHIEMKVSQTEEGPAQMSPMASAGMPGNVQMKYTWCSLQPDKVIYHQGAGVDLDAKLKAVASAGQDSGLLLVASVERIVMPGRLTDAVQVLMTIGNTIRRTPKAKTPLGKISAAIDAVNKEVVDVIKRCIAEGLDVQKTSKITNVSEDLVKEIGQRERGVVDPNVGDKLVLVDVPINARMFAAISQEFVATQQVKLSVVGSKRQVLASHTLELAELVGAPHKEDEKGVLHIAHPDLPDTHFKLFTKFLLVPYHK